MVILVMGVSGAGKTVVGRSLAEKLNWRFVEGDDYHPKSNIEKMPLHNEQPLLGQCALVTGGSSGIGVATARALAGAGANVVINYLSDLDEANGVVGIRCV